MRRLPPEPVPILAPASRWFARSALGLCLIAVIGVRFGGVPHVNGLQLMGGGIFAAVLALVAAGGALTAIWRTGAAGTALTARAVALALVVLALPAYFAVQAVRLPILNDITTDPEEAPSFGRSRAALDARRNHVPAEYDRQNALQQAESYPDLRTIVIEQNPDETMALVRRAATAVGWTIVDAVNPAGRTSAGRVEAIATSRIFRFPDDITIRIRPGAGDTRVDVRSVSRYGRHDFGVNAARIRAFTTELDNLAAGRT
jgi:uncharacterized protein (DUF1499 family)